MRYDEVNLTYIRVFPSHYKYIFEIYLATFNYEENKKKTLLPCCFVTWRQRR